MKRLLIIFGLAVAGCTPQKAVAPAYLIRDYKVYDERVAPLINFVHDNSIVGYALNARYFPIDSIVSVDPRWLVERSNTPFGRDTRLSAMTLTLRATRGGKIIYQPAILMDGANFSFDDPYQISALIHELVHYAQLSLIVASLDKDPYGKDTFDALASRMGWECDKAAEREAYRVQNLWLIKHHPGAVISDARIANASRCTNPHQPASAIVTRGLDVDELERAAARQH